MTRTFIIADIASAHDGVLEHALDAVTVAAGIGCDAFKMQYWSSADRLAERRHATPEYRDIYRRYQIPAWWLELIAARCIAERIEFMCTVFLPEDVPIIDPLIQRWKVSAFEAESESLWTAISARSHKPRIVSTNGTTNDLLLSLGSQDTVLHCVSGYPVRRTELNIKRITKMKKKYPNVGLSDHSGVVIAGALAVAAGARVVEAHLSLPSTNSANPDGGVWTHRPGRFAKYVDLIRLAENLVGDGADVDQECEQPFRGFRVKS